MGRQTLLAAAIVVISVSGCASKPEHARIAAGSGGPSTTLASSSGKAPPTGHSCPVRITPTPDAHGDINAVAIDYVDAVHFDGHDYQSVDNTPVKHTDLDASVSHVVCTLLGPSPVDPAYRMQDGDATFVPVGSSIYAVKGVSPDRELAAEHDGVMRLYKAVPGG